jgi:general secretion pathway protein E
MVDIVGNMILEGVLSPEEGDRVRALRASGTELEAAVVTTSPAAEERLLGFLAGVFHVPYVDLEECRPPREFLGRFPARLLLEHQLLPLREEPGGALLVATCQLSDTTGLDELRLTAGCECRPALALRAELTRHLTASLGVGADTVQSLVSGPGRMVQVLERESDEGLDLNESAQDASIIGFVNEVLTEAIGARATDVHFEPFEDELRVRYRVDGVLREAALPPDVRRFQAAIISRLKVLSNLDIAEKRLPQDGRIQLRIDGREFDVRVSVIPMRHGEAVVLRLLDRNSALLGLEKLGMSARDRGSFRRILALPHGIVLVTGPTGSGKTTTLYAALSRINDVSRKIITIEDPVEYELRGVNQIQVSTKSGMTFARGLRSILRHDPDVILVGEIRDPETAEIAVQASLTGHLVFATLHTNDAPGAPTRLIDMGIEPYLIASSLEAVLAQRLVRLICLECREQLPADAVERVRREYGLEGLETLYAGRGCRRCQGTGYHDRAGIFELMMVTDEIRSLLLEHASAGVLRACAEREGMRSLWDDSLRLLQEGRTTVEEVLRATKAGTSNGSPLASTPDDVADPARSAYGGSE